MYGRGATAGFKPENLWSVQTRAATITRLVDQSVGTKLIRSYFRNQNIISVIFRANPANICWVQPFKCEDLMLFSDMYSMMVN